MDQTNEDYINKRLVYCSLLLQEYAYRELLSSHLLVKDSRYKVKTKYKYVKNQLLQLEKDSGVSKEIVEKSQDLALNNVGLMATIMGTLALIPECQVDFLEREFGKICQKAVENFEKNKDNEMDN